MLAKAPPIRGRCHASILRAQRFFGYSSVSESVVESFLSAGGPAFGRFVGLAEADQLQSGSHERVALFEAGRPRVEVDPQGKSLIHFLRGRWRSERDVRLGGEGGDDGGSGGGVFHWLVGFG